MLKDPAEKKDSLIERSIHKKDPGAGELAEKKKSLIERSTAH